MTKNPALPYAWMLLGSLAFSTMGALAHGLGESCDWRIVAISRTALALFFATTLAVAARAPMVFLRPPTMWLRSIAGSISLVCTFYALPRLPVADVLTLTNVFPIWVALLSWPMLGEAPSWQAWIAIAVGIFGVVLVQQPHFDAQAPGAALPAILAMVSSMTSAVAMLGLHRLQGIDPRAIVAHFSGVALAVCLASLWLAPDAGWSSAQFDDRTIAMLLGVGVCATIGQLFLTKAFAAGPPAKVSVVALSQVVFAVLFDVLVWGRSFGATTLVGMVLVMAPTAWLLISQGQAAAGDI